LAIALLAARDGANIAIVAKTVVENPKIPGTIHSAAAEIERAGGKALALQCDIRFEDQVVDAVKKTVETFGGIDILVNNASAISLTGTESTDLKRYRLMHEINVGGTFLVSKHVLPHLKKAANPHILTLSPPLNLSPKWFGPHLAYTISKYGMSMITLGLAEEYKPFGIAANSLWPETAIATAAVANKLGGTESLNSSRKPEIVADAAHTILTKPASQCTGQFFIDSEVLKAAGVTDFDSYAVQPGRKLLRDFFLDDQPEPVTDSKS
jgi:citronellol/citronellal dehydrogenase